MHEIAPAPGESEMSHEATKKASQVSNGIGRAREKWADDSTERGPCSPRSPASIERSPERPEPERADQSHEQRDRPELRRDLGDAVALEQHAADDAQEMRERQHLADRLRPARHPAEREHE